MGSFVATWSSGGEFVFSARKNNDSLAKSKYQDSADFAL
jgi:hypothetical protein